MEHVHNIVVVLETLEEPVDLLLFLFGEFTCGKRDALEFEGLDFKTFIFKELGYGTIVGEVSVDKDFILITEDLVDIAVDEFKLELVHINIVAPSDDEGTLALEEEVIHTHGAELALTTDEGSTEIGDSAGRIVCGGLDDYGNTVRTFAVVDDLLVGRLVLLSGTLDSAFDILLGHRLALGGLHEQTQAEVARGIGTASEDGQFDFLTNLGEGTGHMAPTFQFSCFTVFKCSSHSKLKIEN